MEGFARERVLQDSNGRHIATVAEPSGKDTNTLPKGIATATFAVVGIAAGCSDAIPFSLEYLPDSSEFKLILNSS